MLSVLIVNWNTKDLLLACLESIVRFPPAESTEVIVVDNASCDGSAEAVEGWIAEKEASALTFRLIQSPTNSGYAKGNNQAFAVAQGAWLLTLNPDTEVFAGTLQAAVDTLRGHPDAAALGAKQISPDGTTQQSVRGFPSLLGIIGTLIGFEKGPFGSYGLPSFDYETEQDCPQPMGTFILFRREALAQVGDPSQPFDESFPIFFNEVDLLYRLRKAGWECVYSPAVRVLHHGGESTRQVRPQMIWESHRSLIRYLRKHRLRWWNVPLLGLVFAAIWLGALARTRTIDVGFRP